MTAVIVDDKPANIRTLQEMLRIYCPEVSVTGTAADIEEAYVCISKLSPEIVLLDIEMPPGNGFDLLRKFKTISFEVIFITAFDQYAIKAFRENALDYLLKPVDIDLLQEAVSKAGKQIELKQTNASLRAYLQQTQKPVTAKISLPTQHGYLFIDHGDIIRCEASGSYSHIYTVNGDKIIVSMRLKECEDLLPSTLFFRIHHSHLINLQFINQYFRGKGGFIQMKDGSEVTVAASKKDAFLDIMKHQPQTIRNA